jgi:Domain of unknown function (DUF4384)
MSLCPSRLELSRWEAFPEADRPVEMASHVGRCGRCAAIVGDIAEARALLLGPNPAVAGARAARAIFAEVEDRKRRRWRWWSLLAPAFLVPAAAALLLFAKPTHGPGGDSRVIGRPIVMGRLIVETFCKRGDQVFRAEDGGDFFQGDRLRFAYSQDRPGFLTIFGVDDSGQVFPYYPDGTLAGLRSEAGAHLFLPDSVELDGHRGWERIFAIWSETQLGDDAIRSAIGVARATANGDLRRMTTLDLPVEQVSLLLRRP